MRRPHRSDRGRSQGTRHPRPADVPSSGLARARSGLIFSWLAVTVAVGLLAWSARTPTFGAAVADDYAMLAWQRLQHHDPVSWWFSTMGAAWYWRPVSRQLWFALVGPFLPGTPVVPAALAVVLLLVTGMLLYHLTRNRLGAGGAAMVAMAPLLSEPLRALIVWPSGAQHLLALMFASAALLATARGRPWWAAACALLAASSHEIGGLAFAAVALLPLLLRRGRPAVRTAMLAAAGGAALWAGGYAVALRHGVGIPSGGAVMGRIPEAFRRALVAVLDLEPLEPGARTACIAAMLVILVIAVVRVSARPGPRRRLRAAWPLLLAGVAWTVAGIAPLAGLLPDWNAWRTTTAALGIVLALAAGLALVSPWLAVGAVAVRCAALIAAPPAPELVDLTMPPAVSDLSFERIVRLQRIVESTRHVLAPRLPTLPRGAALQWWNIPRFAEVGFRGTSAVRVWTRDSTVTWSAFGGATRGRGDVVIEFDEPDPWPARLIDSAALAHMEAGVRAELSDDRIRADSLFVLAVAAQPVQAPAFEAAALIHRARMAIKSGRLTTADSLLNRAMSLNPMDANAPALRGWTLALRGDREGAQRAAGLALELDARNPTAQSLLQRLRAATPAR